MNKPPFPFAARHAIKPLPPDDRDFKLGALISLPKVSGLPRRFSLGEAELHDQIADDNTDFCSGCSSSGAAALQDGVTFYYPFVFAASKYLTGDPESWGQDLRAIAKAWTKFGCIPRHEVPDYVKKMTPQDRRIFAKYPDDMKVNAKVYIKDTFAMVSGPYDAYDNIRTNIYARFLQNKIEPAIFGCYFDWPLYDYILKGIPRSVFGHAMYITGWDDDGLEVVNSAGPDAGKNGRHRITRDAINYCVPIFGALMMTDIPREEAERRIRDNQMQQLNFIQKMLLALQAYFRDIMR